MLADPDCQRAAVPHHENASRCPRDDRSYRKCALQAGEGRVGRGFRGKPAPEMKDDEMGNGFGIGIGLELMAGIREFRAERREVLDDPVVHDRDLGIAVRMGVGLVRDAVRGPTGVGDSGVSRHRCVLEHRLEVGDTSRSPAPLHPSVVERGDPAGVVTPVGEVLETVEEGRRGTMLRSAHHADDSAHRPELAGAVRGALSSPGGPHACGGAFDGERGVRHIAGNRAAGADDGVAADAHRGHQG